MSVVKIVNDDCLNLLKSLEDCSVDLVVTDPPYKIISGGCNAKNRLNEPTGIFNKRDIPASDLKRKWFKNSNVDFIKTGKLFKHNEIKFKDWMSEVYRVMKNQTHAYFMVNDRNLYQLIQDAQLAGFKLQNVLVWKKNNATPNKYYMKNCEFVVMFRKGKAKNINNMGTKSVIEVNNIIGNKLHPTEKPVELLEILISNSSKFGDLVLDPFVGAGSAAVASLALGRNFIGSEIDQEYFQIANHRVSELQDFDIAA